MTPERAELVLLLESELLRQAFSSLAARDRRFEIRDLLVGLQSSGQGAFKPVALSHQWANGPEQIRLLKSHAVVGVVLLSDSQPSRYDSPSNWGLPTACVRWDKPWSYVAASLLELHRNANPGCDLPRVESGSCVSAEELVLKSLTRREMQVLGLIAEGYSARRMAAALHLAESTIDNHKSGLLKKFGVRKSIELARIAYRLGVVLP
ncbi:MAG: response regulator transcription factor [Planctomycetales bacterium]|nr:response regulator transcription factor [Planctomycetales bacterium]